MSYNLDTITSAVMSSLSPDLKTGKFKNMPGLAGYCYVACEAIYHLNRLVGERGDKRVQLTPCHMTHEGVSHWVLQAYTPDGPIVLDPTVSQFSETPDYEQMRKQRFLTSYPSKRAEKVMARATKKLEENSAENHLTSR